MSLQAKYNSYCPPLGNVFSVPEVYKKMPWFSFFNLIVCCKVALLAEREWELEHEGENAVVFVAYMTLGRQYFYSKEEKKHE